MRKANGDVPAHRCQIVHWHLWPVVESAVSVVAGLEGLWPTDSDTEMNLFSVLLAAAVAAAAVGHLQPIH